jgi:hypothetical protein
MLCAAGAAVSAVVTADSDPFVADGAAMHAAGCIGGGTLFTVGATAVMAVSMERFSNDLPFCSFCFWSTAGAATAAAVTMHRVSLVMPAAAVVAAVATAATAAAAGGNVSHEIIQTFTHASTHARTRRHSVVPTLRCRRQGRLGMKEIGWQRASYTTQSVVVSGE